jgi:putative transposase
LFDNLDEVREVFHEFVDDYNNHRHHDALGGISLRKYRELMPERSNPIEGLRFASAKPSLHHTLQWDCSPRKELSTFELY